MRLEVYESSSGVIRQFHFSIITPSREQRIRGFKRVHQANGRVL